MLAVVFRQGRAVLEERPRPVPGPGEALVQVLCAGICRTDLELLAGYHGFSGIPGHEFAGRVAEAPGAPELIGRMVAADINIGCGVCPLCLSGDPRHCPQRTVLGIRGRDGAFAEFLALPLDVLRPVPDGLRAGEAVFAEPLAAALAITRKIHVTGRMRVLVQGDGTLGLLAAMALRPFAPDLTVLGRHPEKLALAARAGARTALMGAEGVPAGLGLFDLVVEATGRPGGLAQALDLVRPQGIIAAKTTIREAVPLDLARLVVQEITLAGSRCGDVAQALDFLARGLAQVRPLVRAVHSLEQAPQALEQAGRPGAGKVLLRMPGGHEEETSRVDNTAPHHLLAGAKCCPHFIPARRTPLCPANGRASL